MIGRKSGLMLFALTLVAKFILVRLKLSIVRSSFLIFFFLHII